MEDTATTVKDSAPAAPSAPAATPAAPSGPAASTPASTPAAPRTALDAVNAANDRLSKAAPSAAPTTGPTPAASVTPPGPAANVPPVVEPEGIRNLRTAYEGYKGKVGWAENLSQEEVQTALGLIADMRRDPVAFFRDLQSELTGHPEYSKMLGAGTAPAAEPEPGPDLFTTDGQGQRVELYSAAQQKKWREWNDKRVNGQLDQRLSPLQDWHKSAQQQEQQRQLLANAQSTTTAVLKQMRDLPHFKDGEDKIAARLAKIDPATKKQLGAIGSLNLAYNLYLKEEVFPTYDSKAEARVRAEFDKKANAGGSVKPGGGQAPATGGKRPTNQRELAAHLQKLSEAQAAS